MRHRPPPLEYFLDMYVNGRLEDSQSKRHEPEGGSPKEQALAYAQGGCHTFAKYGGGDAVVVSRLDRADGDLVPMLALACCFERGPDGRRVAHPRKVRAPKDSYDPHWAPPASACRR